MGIWRNVEDLEDALTLPELSLILETSREQRNNQNKFLAAIQGIDLDKNKKSEDNAFEDVKRRVEARISGVSEEQLEFAELGIQVEEWED